MFSILSMFSSFSSWNVSSRGRRHITGTMPISNDNYLSWIWPITPYSPYNIITLRLLDICTNLYQSIRFIALQFIPNVSRPRCINNVQRNIGTQLGVVQHYMHEISANVVHGLRISIGIYIGFIKRSVYSKYSSFTPYILPMPTRHEACLLWFENITITIGTYAVTIHYQKESTTTIMGRGGTRVLCIKDFVRGTD